MKYPFTATLTDRERASQMKNRVYLGHHFVFVHHQKHQTTRNKRLLVNVEDKNVVLPLVSDPVELAGLLITPDPLLLEPIGCVVADRTLYRAHEDPVHLFIAAPTQLEAPSLLIEQADEIFAERTVTLMHGLGLETLAGLPCGQYTAQLLAGHHRVGLPITFTVAEYILTSLSAHLLSYRIKQATSELWFELRVESYQIPFDKMLSVILVEQGKETAYIGLLPLSPGHYAGGCKITGVGPFQLRLIATDDATRTTEITVPSIQQTIPRVSVISELGQERRFALLPAPQALALRGGYVTSGDFLPAPVTVTDILTDRHHRLIQVNTNVESLVLINFDLSTSHHTTQYIGNVTAGSTLTAAAEGMTSMVFVGCFVYGQPFEGYTSFIEPHQLQLSVEVAKVARPHTDLRITLRGPADKMLPILLCVRNQQEVGALPPDGQLAAAIHSNINALIKNMEDYAFVHVMDMEDIKQFTAFDEGLVEELELYLSYERFEQARQLLASAIDKYPQYQPYRLKLLEVNKLRDKRSLIKKNDGLAQLKTKIDNSPLFLEEDALPLSLENEMEAELAEEDELSLEALETAEEDFSFDTALQLVEEAALLEETEQQPPKENYQSEPTQAEFPTLFFYDIIQMTHTTVVDVPLGDFQGALSVEAFALSEGDWLQQKNNVMVEKPVNVDLRLPPAIHAEDKIMGGLHVTTTARHKVRIQLTYEGQAVTLYASDQAISIETHTVKTPIQLVFEATPGHYVAQAEDLQTGEIDSQAIQLDTLGHYTTSTQALALLQTGESLRLDTTTIALHWLEGLEGPIQRLSTALVQQPSHCCVQLAAKALAIIQLYSMAIYPRYWAENTLFTVIAQLRAMARFERGFALYTHKNSPIDKTISLLTVRLLWQLHPFSTHIERSPRMQQAIQEGITLADSMAEVHRIQYPPTSFQCMEEVYLAAHLGKDSKAIRQFIEKIIDFSGHQAHPRQTQHAVADRALLAYTAASLMAIGYPKWGIRIADQITRQFNAQGALYSTLDSVAALVLLKQLQHAELLNQKIRLRINGVEKDLSTVKQQNEPIESIEVLEGIAIINIQQRKTEDWQTWRDRFPIKTTLQSVQENKHWCIGDRLDLSISLPEGYQVGDVVHLHLPACLAWIQGDKDRKQYILDFAGQAKLHVPLVVVTATTGPQHFALCVRNLFQEERVSSTDWLQVSAEYQSG